VRQYSAFIDSRDRLTPLFTLIRKNANRSGRFTNALTEILIQGKRGK